MVRARSSNLLGKITILLVICCCCLPAHAKYGVGIPHTHSTFVGFFSNIISILTAPACLRPGLSYGPGRHGRRLLRQFYDAQDTVASTLKNFIFFSRAYASSQDTSSLLLLQPPKSKLKQQSQWLPRQSRQSLIISTYTPH